MSPVTSEPIHLPDPDATARLAAALARVAVPGDTLLLEGDLGSGKTHFARAFIHARLADAGMPPEDVPSPTYTLVQTYDAGPVEIWHSDLYRLTGIDEVIELGLDDAFDTAIVLVEWPDRLGSLTPGSAVTLRLSPTADDGRIAHVMAQDRKWSVAVAKAQINHG